MERGNGNYLAVYHLNQGGGATSFDSTANGYNGTNMGVSATTGIFGSVTAFAGSVSSVVTVPSVMGSPTSTLTVEGWAQSSGSGNQGIIYLGANSSCFQGVSLSSWYGPSNNEQAEWGSYCGYGAYGYSLITSAPVGWNQFVTTISATSNLGLFYENGAVIGTSTMPHALTYGSATTTIGNALVSGYSGVYTSRRVGRGSRFERYTFRPGYTEYNNQSTPSTFYTLGSQVTSGSSSNPAPVLTSISPASTTEGSAATAIMLTGSSFITSSTIACSGGGSAFNGYTYERPITVSGNTNIASGTQSNFPMLVCPARLQHGSRFQRADRRQIFCTAPNGGRSRAISSIPHRPHAPRR